MKKFLILSLAALTLASVGAMAQGESNVPEGKRITCYHVYSDKRLISHRNAAIGPSVSLSTLRPFRIV